MSDERMSGSRGDGVIKGGESGSVLESPGRRTLFTLLALAAGAAITGALGTVLGILAMAPLRKRQAEGAGRLELGTLATFAPTREGKAGPQEIVITRTVADGYMMRRVKQRVAVVADPQSSEGLAVLSTTCTHLGCGVSWNAGRKAFLCPCHGGMYSPDGKVIGGPPPRPLARLPFVVEAGRLSLDLALMAEMTPRSSGARPPARGA
jgi:Rieske Fe-S protein